MSTKRLQLIGDLIKVDSEISETSDNAISNKAVAEKINEVVNSVTEVRSYVDEKHTWESLPDKPFYKEGEEKWLLEKTDLILAGDSSYSFEVNDEIVNLFSSAGNTVYIYCNGTIYECVTAYQSVAMYYYVSFNEYTLWYESGTALNLDFGKLMTGICEFGLLSEVLHLKQIDEEYIPDSIARSEDIPKEMLLYTEQILTEDQQMQARKNQGLYYKENVLKTTQIYNDTFVYGYWSTDFSDLTLDYELSSGDYFVELKQSKYECYEQHYTEDKTGIGVRWVGNIDLVDNNHASVTTETVYNDYPFCIYNLVGSSNDSILYFVIDSNITFEHKDKFVFSKSEGYDEVYNQIPENYIPSNIPNISTAEVRQVVAVKTVDENGKPTEWECVNETQSDWNQNDENAVDYIKNKPDIATDEEIIEMLVQEDIIPIVTDSDGSILADENDNVLLW